MFTQTLKNILGVEAPGANRKQVVKAMKLLRRTFSPVLISDVAMQANGQGIFLRAELEAREGDEFRRLF